MCFQDIKQQPTKKETKKERIYLQSKSEDKFKEHKAKGKIKG